MPEKPRNVKFEGKRLRAWRKPCISELGGHLCPLKEKVRASVGAQARLYGVIEGICSKAVTVPTLSTQLH